MGSIDVDREETGPRVDLLQIDLLAARPRHDRAELEPDHQSAQCKDGADGPEDQRRARRAHAAKDVAWAREDAGPNHPPEQDACDIPRPHMPSQSALRHAHVAVGRARLIFVERSVGRSVMPVGSACRGRGRSHDVLRKPRTARQTRIDSREQGAIMERE